MGLFGKDQIMMIVWVIIIGVVLVLIPWRSLNRRKEQRSDLLKTRNGVDQKDFLEHFMNLGYTEKFLELALNVLQNQFMTKKFIPLVTDSFRNDYGWSGFIADQYSTHQMRYAGILLRDIKAISVTESDWANYQETNGTIDSFDQLFDYVIGKLPDRVRAQYFVGPN